MSTTDELLAELTQRGVEYKNLGDLTFWLDENGVKWCTQEQPSGALHLQAITLLTPAQAITATLGESDATPTQQSVAKTCHPVPIYGFDGEFTEYDCDVCSECGTEWDDDMPNFCPNCGAKVVYE